MFPLGWLNPRKLEWSMLMIKSHLKENSENQNSQYLWYRTDIQIIQMVELRENFIQRTQTHKFHSIMRTMKTQCQIICKQIGRQPQHLRKSFLHITPNIPNGRSLSVWTLVRNNRLPATFSSLAIIYHLKILPVTEKKTDGLSAAVIYITCRTCSFFHSPPKIYRGFVWWWKAT